MIGHLGERVSALLDGQLSPAEEERAWGHVHTCHQCRDQVEREGWVKTRLAGLSLTGTAGAPSWLKGSLQASFPGALSPGDAYLADSPDARPRRAAMVALGGGAVGAAVMGVLALGTAPADAPTFDRRLPTTSISTPAPVGFNLPQRRGLPTP